MAELAEGILGKIEEQTTLHNKKLDKMIAAQLKGDKLQGEQDATELLAQKAITKYEQEQQGQEIQYSKIGQHLQDKTMKELQRQSETDTPGLLSDKDIVTVTNADLEDLEKEKAAKADKAAESGEKRTKILEEMKDEQKFLLGKTIGNWVESGKNKLNEMASFDNFQGAVKADMDLMMGKFQLLTTLPGVQSLLQGLKFLFGTLVTFFVAGKFGNFFEPMIQKVEEALMLLGIKSKAGVTEAREARKKLRETSGDKIVKSKGGKEFSADSPQGKMIKNIYPAGLMGSIKDGYRDLSEKAGKHFKVMGDWVGDVFKKNIKKPLEEGLKGPLNKFQEKFTTMGDSLKKMGKSLLGRFKNFVSADSKFGRAMRWVGRGLLKIGKRMMKMMTRLFIQVGIFFASIAMAIAGFILANIIPIAIIAVIALLIIGVVLLVKYLMAKWEEIKINFNEAVDMFKLKFSGPNLNNFFSTIVENIWLGIQQIGVNIRVGVENMVNSLIEKINSWLPDSMAMDKVDWGGAEASAKMDAERTRVEGKQQGRSDALAAQEKEIRDKYDEQRVAAGIAPKNTVTQTNVNNTTQSKQYIASGTSASDAFALNMASRSPTY